MAVLTETALRCGRSAVAGMPIAQRGDVRQGGRTVVRVSLSRGHGGHTVWGYQRLHTATRREATLS